MLSNQSVIFVVVKPRVHGISKCFHPGDIVSQSNERIVNNCKICGICELASVHCDEGVDLNKVQIDIII